MTNIDALEEQAVDAAVQQNWDLAVELNKQILSVDESNLGAYMRLGFASMHINNLKAAKEYYKKALKIQPSNRIAQENLEKASILEENGKKNRPKKTAFLDPNLFLDIPGKTKTVRLVNLGQKEELAGITIGQEVDLKLKKRRIEVRTKHNEYIGCLPDDISRRLEFFIQEKSLYKTYIKEPTLNEVVVFINEDTKGPKVTQYVSFPKNPQTIISDLYHHDEAEGEHDDEDDIEAEQEWVGVGEEAVHEDKDEDLAHIQGEEDEDNEEE